MDRTAWARAAFGATAAAAAAGLALATVTTLTAEGGDIESPVARLVDLACFFTVQSNLIVGVTCLLLAIDPGRSSLAFQVFRFVGVVDIAITGVVYHLVLATPEHTAVSWTADLLVHTVVPVACVAGWIAFGPRGRATWQVALLSTLVPLAWVALTLVRGAIVDRYPYPFVDVGLHGYGGVVANLVGVAAFFFALCAVAVAADRHLPGLRPRPPT